MEEKPLKQKASKKIDLKEEENFDEKFLTDKISKKVFSSAKQQQIVNQKIILQEIEEEDNPELNNYEFASNFDEEDENMSEKEDAEYNEEKFKKDYEIDEMEAENFSRFFSVNPKEKSAMQEIITDKLKDLVSRI